jgi:hypothetical protein
MSRVSVEREAPNGLSRAIYEFYLDERLRLYLDSISEESRKTRNPKHWKGRQTYTRLTYGRPKNFSEPVVPEDVKAEAIKKVQDSVVFEIWKDR